MTSTSSAKKKPVLKKVAKQRKGTSAPSLPQFVTTDQLADMLQVSSKTVERLNDGDPKFPRFYRIKGDLKRYLLGDVLAYLESKKQVGNKG